MDKKFLLFDFDGVLVDTAQLSFEVLPEYFPGITQEEILSLYDGNGVATALTLAQTRGIVDPIDHMRSMTARFTEATRDVVLLQPARELLAMLAAKYRIYIISTAREDGIASILERSGAAEHIGKIYGHLAHPSKVEKIRMVFAEHGATPEQCLFVTDTLGDLCEAREAGIGALAVSWGFHDRERLAKGSPWAIVDKLEDIPQIVDNYFINS